MIFTYKQGDTPCHGDPGSPNDLQWKHSSMRNCLLGRLHLWFSQFASHIYSCQKIFRLDFQLQIINYDYKHFDFAFK